MKNSILTLLFALSLHFGFAQVMEETRVMAAGSHPALSIVLPGAEVKSVDPAWKEFMKPYGKVTRVKSSKENVVSDVQILDIGGVNRIKVYSLSEAVGEGTKMTVWFDMGTGFISSEAYPKEYVAGVKFLKDFAHKVKLDMITEEFEAQQKLLSKAESSLTKLQRDNDNYHKIIEDSKKRIAQAEADIEKNLTDQELAQKEIELQKDAVKEVEKRLNDCKKQ